MTRPGRDGDRKRLLAALRNPPYRRWFLAQLFSSSGSATQLVGMSWLIAQATDSGISLALLTFAIYAPVLFLGPFAGIAIDAVRRRKILLWTQFAFLTIGLVLVAGAYAEKRFTIVIVYTTAAATGIVNAFDAPARQVYLFDLLEPSMIPVAIGMYEVGGNVARVAGPGIAGILLATGGAGPCFIFNAASFVPTIYVLLRNKDTGRTPSRAPADRPRLTDGIRWVAANLKVIAMLALAMASGMVFNQSVALPLITMNTFHLAGGAYGTFLAVYGVGALLGAVGATTLASKPKFATTVAVAALTGTLVVCTSLAPRVWMFALGLAAMGAAGIWFIARANAYVQLAAPGHMRGQVMTLWNMVLPGLGPITGFAIGAAIERYGPRAGLALPGLVFLVIVTATAVGWGIGSYTQRAKRNRNPET